MRYGVKLDNGSWVGLVAMILRGDVHLGNTAFMYTGSRLEAVDYLSPISTAR
jgi:acetyltransferase-like isoleucine patch superfamily enzyme